MIRTRRTRRGVTLVEMLVAAALCISGMWLLSWLYQQGLDSFRQARSQADLTAQQRMVTTILTRDMQYPFFLDEDGKPNRGRRLSDQRTDLALSGGYTPPRGGYFFARSRPAAFEVDPFQAADGFASSRSVDHVLQFTVLLPGGSNFQQFSAEVPVGSASQYYGTAAEVSYYLRPAGFTPGGVPLYDLYRNQRLAARTTDDAPAYRVPASYPDAPDVMVVAGGAMRTFGELTVPTGFGTSYRLQPMANPPVVPQVPFPSTNPRYGEDKLMSNVLSFEVKFTGPAATLGYGMWPSDPGSNVWPRPAIPPAPGPSLPQGLPNSDYPYDNLPFDGQFDTFTTLVAGWQANVAKVGGNSAAPMKPLRITGVQIRLRTYESRTRSTRQTTVIQDL
jgi:hypothetical protein